MSTDKKDEERSATVIPWPGTRVATPPSAPPPEAAAPSSDRDTSAGDASAAPGAGAASEPEEFSMDAFEAAVRRAVEDKLGPVGDTPRFPPRGADELVAQVFSALSGKDGKTALAEVRERLASESKGPSPVIDLAAAREARKKVTPESTSRITGALKDTFGQFMAQLSASQGNRSEIVLDSGFFREHGASLLGNLFQGLASALMQGAKADNAAAAAPPAEASPPSESAPAPSGEAATPPAPTEPPPEPAPRPAAEPVQVQVRVDFASILSSLFRKPKPPPTEPPEGGSEPR